MTALLVALLLSYPPHDFRYHIDRHPVRGEIVVDPEVPPRVVHRVPPRYTETARKARIEGVVVVRVLVERDGTVSAAKILKPLPFGLDQAAVECVRRWRFAPARDHRRTVRSIYNARVAFRLR